MIIIDSSVWIALFRGADTEPVSKLQSLYLDFGPLVGDLLLLEVPQGAKDSADARRIEEGLGGSWVAAGGPHRAGSCAHCALPFLQPGTNCSRQPGPRAGRSGR